MWQDRFWSCIILKCYQPISYAPSCCRSKDTDILAFSEATFKSTVSDNESALRKVIRIPESGKFLIVESGILGLGIRNLVQGNLTPRAFSLRK